jgi:integrase
MNIRYYEKTPGRWHLDIRCADGRRLRPYGGPTEATARKESKAIIARVFAAPVAPTPAIVPVPEAAGPTLLKTYEKALKVREEWLQSKDKGTLATTYRGLKLPDSHPMAALTRDAVRELRGKWMAEPGKRKGTTLAASTINSRLSMLSVLLEVEDLPPHTVKHLSTKGNARHRRISDTELAAMTAWAQSSHLKDAPAFGRLMVAGLEAGGRLSELLGAEVDLKERTATFRDTKNSLSRTVPLTEAAARALEAPWPASLTADRVTALWDAMRASMGLAGDHRFVFHLLRHECASRLADRGLGSHTIMAMLGHENITTSESYVKLSLAGLRRSVMGVPQAGPATATVPTSLLSQSDVIPERGTVNP